MKLPLTNDVWSRLYGPYGNRCVNKTIAKLEVSWDQDTATELLWEELHHQDDIYPATFAALPWLLDSAPKYGEAFEDVNLFLSHVISCASQQFEGKAKGPYRGLSTTISDHHHSWLPEHEWLKDDDRTVLVALEEWFTQSAGKIAEDCLQLVDDNLIKTAYALEGFATLHGGGKVARAAQMFADGEDQNFIETEIGLFGHKETHVVAALNRNIKDRNKEMAVFLDRFPRKSSN